MTQNTSKNFFRVGAEDFKKIPGSPIAYWVSPACRQIFGLGRELDCIVDTAQGMKTLDNERFIRYWAEISYSNMYSPHTWVPINHGGDFRKWFGNNDFVVNWANDGYDLKKFAIEKYNSVTRTVTGMEHYLHSGLTWTAISSSKFGARFFPEGFLFSNAGMCAFGKQDDVIFSLALLNSAVSIFTLKILSPTINYGPNQIKKIPLPHVFRNQEIYKAVQSAIGFARTDWNSCETSWDFQSNPLLDANEHCNCPGKINTAYLQLREEWRMSCEEMRKLEVENNRIFIEAYGLQEELSPEVPWNEITLTCNPWYRYGKSPATTTVEGKEYFLSSKDCAVGDVTAIGEMGTAHVGFSDNHIPTRKFPFNQELEQRLLEDTVKEFISYAVGCMMGRYSPEKPGLILANQSSSLDEDQTHYETTVTGSNLFTVDPTFSISFTVQAGKSRLTSPLSSFYPEMGNGKHFVMDRNGILPILDDEWFMDDIVAQFKAFLTLTFGEEHFAKNLQFIEGALGKDIRKYFMKDFYKEHIQRYKKRPIYWLFSSPKGSFNALIYMHRYRPDTISIVLNDYLRDFITKLTARREHLIAENTRADLPRAARTRNLKLIDKYGSMLAELEAYERDILFPLAQKKIAIDLDDGVKVNYCKFGDALKQIPKLASEEN